MTRLLYLEASPRKKRSSSIQIAHDYLDVVQETHPDVDVETFDLWQKELPRFDGDVIDAKYAIMHGQSHTEAQRKAWRSVEQVIAEFKRADYYLFSLPMWNFGVPYPLKHFFDVVVQPSYTFSFSPEEGYKGLVNGKKAVIIYSRGGAYGAESGAEDLDYQKTYMETILNFIGVKDIQSVIIEPTLASPEAKEAALSKARELAIQLAKELN